MSVTRRSKPIRLQSWIPPSFAWMTADIFSIETTIEDHNLVEFISTGRLEIPVTTKEAARVLNALGGEKTLFGQLQEAVSLSEKLKIEQEPNSFDVNIRFFCHGVFLLPGEARACVVAGRAMPSGHDAWISAALKVEADTLLKNHQSKMAEFDAEIERKKLKDEEFYDRLAEKNPALDVGKLKSAGDVSLAMAPDQRPILTAAELLHLLPRAVTFQMPRAGDADKIAKSAVAAIAASSFPPSRDGTYAGILPNRVGREARGIVSWTPHDGPPSYLEVRWALQRRLPAALRKPRSMDTDRPEISPSVQPGDNAVATNGLNPSSADIQEALQDLQLDQTDLRDRVDAVRRDIERKGYEAIAWFQPYHIFAEETWGIYFDAPKLDDFACSLLDDFRSRSVSGSHGLAAYLAFGLTYAHELFHARVEAALSWSEINALQPKYLRYKERVYDALRQTPEWLEEALANWSAWEWFKSDAVRVVMTNQTTKQEDLERVVEASLDLSPPGYRDWQVGHEAATWSIFATQLSTGKREPTSSSAIGLPIKSILTGPLPYDFQPSDIPLRFLGEGLIASLLQSHPATLNQPSRRELERALKYFNHNLDASGGKGGHQKWTGPDQRAFILPTRDPVSAGVFKTFLHHVGIDKATYLRQVRPNL